MGTLAAGVTTSITIEAGETLRISGIAEISLRTGSVEVINGSGTYGPYDTSVTATIKTISVCAYDTALEGPAPAFIYDDDGDVIGVKNLNGTDELFDSTSYTLKIAIGIAFSQSNELGASYVVMPNGDINRFYLSAPSQGICEPLPEAPAGSGSMFTRVAELLGSRDNVRVQMYNGSVGGSSGIYDWCGTINMSGRANSTAYRGFRASEGVGDPGHRGECIYVNGATWEATTGNRHLAFTQTPLVFNSITYYSNPGNVIAETSLTSAASPPVFPGSPVLGNTVTDGGIVWTCINVGAKTADGGTTIRVFRNSDIGFDPYFMLSRVRTGLMQINVQNNKRFVYFQNGQRDAGANTVVYELAMRIAALFIAQFPFNIIPIFGLSTFQAESSIPQYDNLETALSGGGLATPPNYATSPLTVGMTGSSWNLATPGQTVPTRPFYYGQSLYRYYGTAVSDLGIVIGQPHLKGDGSIRAAEDALYPTIRRIVLNSAT